jgi:hypothetical protein
MVQSSTPSIIEEDEIYDNDEYDYDRVHFTDDKRMNTSLMKNQNEPLPQITSPTT